MGTTIGLIKGDTRSLDYGQHGVFEEIVEAPLYIAYSPP